MPIFRNDYGEAVVEFGDVEMSRCRSRGDYQTPDQLGFISALSDVGSRVVLLKFTNTDQIDAVIHELTEIRNQMWLAAMLQRFRDREAISGSTPLPVENQNTPTNNQ